MHGPPKSEGILKSGRGRAKRWGASGVSGDATGKVRAESRSETYPHGKGPYRAQLGGPLQPARSSTQGRHAHSQQPLASSFRLSRNPSRERHTRVSYTQVGCTEVEYIQVGYIQVWYTRVEYILTPMDFYRETDARQARAMAQETIGLIIQLLDKQPPLPTPPA